MKNRVRVEPEVFDILKVKTALGSCSEPTGTLYLHCQLMPRPAAMHVNHVQLKDMP